MREAVCTIFLADTASLSVAGPVRLCTLTIYQQYNDTQNEFPAHRCNVNNGGSSGSMESALTLSMVDDLYSKTNGNAFVHEMVTDDDTTMRAVLCHNNKKG